MSFIMAGDDLLLIFVKYPPSTCPQGCDGVFMIIDSSILYDYLLSFCFFAFIFSLCAMGKRVCLQNGLFFDAVSCTVCLGGRAGGGGWG